MGGDRVDDLLAQAMPDTTRRDYLRDLYREWDRIEAGLVEAEAGVRPTVPARATLPVRSPESVAVWRAKPSAEKLMEEASMVIGRAHDSWWRRGLVGALFRWLHRPLGGERLEHAGRTAELQVFVAKEHYRLHLEMEASRERLRTALRALDQLSEEEAVALRQRKEGRGSTSFPPDAS